MIREPILVDAKPLRPGEELRVSLEPYRGQTYASARRWYREGDLWKPGKGLSVRAGLLPWLVVTLQAAEAQALECGVLEEQDYELAGRPIPREILDGLPLLRRG